jgi:hypothetical protein
MFEQSFVFTVTTDANGHFHSIQPVTSPFSLDVKISARLQAPVGPAIHASFQLAPAQPEPEEPPVAAVEFTSSAGETVDLGKWRVVAGENANLATAAGSTDPAAANEQVTVEFVAAPSFF